MMAVRPVPRLVQRGEVNDVIAGEAAVAQTLHPRRRGMHVREVDHAGADRDDIGLRKACADFPDERLSDEAGGAGDDDVAHQGRSYAPPGPTIRTSGTGVMNRPPACR